MKKIIQILLLIIFNVLHLTGQPSIQWQKSLGGTSHDGARSVEQTSDGGYIACGDSASSDGDVTINEGSFDYWIIKMNSTGNLQWQKSYGGYFEDWPESIKQTSDGGFIACGHSASFDGDVTGNHGDNDFWVVKLDSSGNLQWQKTLGGSGDDQGRSVLQTSDGGYIVCGYAASNNGDVTGNHGYNDFWVVKLDSIGNLQWQKALGGTGDDEAYSIKQTFDGGYIVCGSATSNDSDVTGNHGYNDFWVVKLGSTGILQWQKTLGGGGNDVAKSVEQTSDSGYIVCGISGSVNGNVTGNHGYNDFWIVKLDSIGNLQWQKSLGGIADDGAQSVEQTSDGAYIVCGYAASNNGDVTGNHGASDFWLVKLSGTGNLLWQKALGGTDLEKAYAIKQTFDGGYIVCGNSLSNNGNATVNHGGSDFWLVKLNPIITAIEVADSPCSDIQIYPNPVSQSAELSFSLLRQETISVSIFDVTGRKILNIFEGSLDPGSHHIKWNPKGENSILSGIYFLSIKSEGFSKSFRLVVVE